MNTLKAYSKVVLMAIILIICASCTNPFAYSDKQDGAISSRNRYVVRIYIGEDTTAGRTVQPSHDALAGYQLSFAGPVSCAPVDLIGTNHADVALSDGEWTITATAYKTGGEIGSPGDAVASGSIIISISDGIAVNAVPPIILKPSGNTDDGTLHFDITVDPGISGYIKLWEIDGNILVSTFGTDGMMSFPDDPVTGNAVLSSGRYIVEVKLENQANNIAFRREVLEIWAGTTTDFIFTPDEFINPDFSLANSQAILDKLNSTINGISIGNGTGNGDSQETPKIYTVYLSDMENISIELHFEPGSIFSSISWVANTDDDPGEYTNDGHPSNPIDLSTNNILWIKAVSEDGSETMFYKFIVMLPNIYQVTFNTNGGNPVPEKQFIENMGKISEPQNVIKENYIFEGWYTEETFDNRWDFQNDTITAQVILYAKWVINPVFGDFYIDCIDYSGISYTGGVLTISSSGPYTIGMKSGVTSTTTNRIVVASGVNADITLSNINIDVSGTNFASAFNMTGAEVNLTLVGNNILKSGIDRSGLEVPVGATLVITESSTGSLTAIGGGNRAGIGGGYNNTSCGNLTINGGTITAIGGGGAFGGAGIGGGYQGAGGTINITGGIITATGGNGSYGTGGAGIGGGPNGDGGTISITGGVVTSTSYYGAGIGGGQYAAGGGTINTINGNAVVIASSIQPDLPAEENLGPAIVFNGNNGTMYGSVTLSQDVTIPSDRMIFINNGQPLTILDGYILTNNGTIFINNGGIIVGTIVGNQPIEPLFTISGDSAYTYTGGILTITDNGTYNIGMKNGVTSTTIYRILVNSGVNANITLSDVNINMNGASGASAFDMTGATVNLTLLGDNVLSSGSNRAGIQVPDGTTLIITEESIGSLTVTGGSSSAGIGGGNNASGGTMTINGGTITANGNGGAGIGGGYGGSSGTITINGGTVTASGNSGIGGGPGGSGDIINISGGTIVAIGNGSGAGIGGGSGGSGGIINISGGMITASNNATNGTGIGGGSSGGAGGTISITGGVIKATGGGSASWNQSLWRPVYNYNVGIGGGSGGASGTITTISGNAVLIASIINSSLPTNENIGSAIILYSTNGTDLYGTLYGSNVTLDQDVTFSEDDRIPDRKPVLTIPAGRNLTINEGVTLTNNGTINCYGTITNNGTINGTGDINYYLPNADISIGDPSVKLYLNDSTLLDNNGSTEIDYVIGGMFTVNISSGSYSEIKWFLNGNLAAQGTTRTSITLPKYNPGIYMITVEAISGGVKNTGSHRFVVK